MNLEDILKKARPAVLVGQNSGNGSKGTNATAPTLPPYSPLAMGYVPSIDTINIANNKAFAQNALTNEVNKQLSEKGFGVIAPYSKNNVVSAFDPQIKPNETVVNKVQSAKNNGTGGGSGGTSSIIPDYKASLDDLYNKVMGYGSYTPSTFTPNVYTPSVYQRTVDTSGTEALLNQSLNDIHNYGDFKYDLNADMLYQQAIDNYMMKGQQAAADTTAMASALTGGYGNSYAALVGNQAYQDHITQATSMIPQFQQAALNIWQSGYDRLLNDYNATSQQLANLLDIEGMNFNIWNANESNAANAFGMNEANRYNAWQQNEQNRLNEWQLGYGQAMDQYELAKDYYATLEALQKASGGSGGSSSSSNKTSNSTTSKTPTVNQAQQNLVNAYNNILTNMNKPIENPLSEQAYLDYLEALRKK